MATSSDKLIASGVMCVDEVREENGLMPLNTPWSRQHWMTNNYSRIEEQAKPAEGGTD